jgi:hypothetical protein
MPMLFYHRVPGEDKGRVYLEHYQPDILPEDFRKQGVWVDHIPAPPPAKKDARPAMYVNPATGEVWYEYEPSPAPRR